MGFVFFFNDTATTEIYTLSLHDALPISHPVLHAPRTATTKRDHDLAAFNIHLGRREIEAPEIGRAHV